ncbi:DUF1765-domain-containing protein [Massarina eburnea CBS 473.64]|uniref:DUF1765-domain-containing protein n=1 Tax=Massarina eburnea CBS 473.64 TaxID=1395130 RepID=A0A6A6SC46_9PLEO|nr:DUF1765-domain-containing protein [Massarina eburnea CBS 473.64]
MQAVASALRGHDVFASHSQRGRNRAVSELGPPPPERKPDPPTLSKAASYTYFPKVKDLDDPPLLELSGKITEEELKGEVAADGTSYTSSDGSSPDSEDNVVQMPQLRSSNSRRSRFRPFSSKSREPSAEPKPERSRTEDVKNESGSPTPSPARSLTKLRRKSWISPQRSSSPAKEDVPPVPTREEAQPKTSLHVETNGRKSLTAALSIPEKTRPSEDTLSPTTAHKGRVLTKKRDRLSGLFNPLHTEQPPPPVPSHPAVPQVPKSFSTDKLPNYALSPTSPTHIPPLPRNISSDKLKGSKTEPRKKDELWTVFRTLDGDLRKFQSKSMALKANVVRTTLLPFLRTYASHPSNHKLRPEDLDRRANILNGWWTALLELLAGRNNQSISGTDRPAILEGITGIMERQEWRLAPSPFCALADRTEPSSTQSTASSSSDFLADSVYHNVRNIFTQNLLSQMAFAVDKMSLRNAAASLVTFCGKTCAYAFCFCPGIADVLVRLWSPSANTMKRLLVESGVTRLNGTTEVSDRIAAAFPQLLHSLNFQSLAKTVRMLRQPAALPLGTANLDWFGSWTKRWSGAESDLFYVFVKHYHIIVSEFLPKEPNSIERICVPGFLIVQAQVLTNLDATIHRHAAPQPDESAGPTSVTFDDVLGGDADASASTVPIPPANATRQMAENRLIMLIRDFLSDRNSHIVSARRMFAESFGVLLHAAARKVSIYENNACYTLCDFLEEAFVIIFRYEQLDDHAETVLDWPFWLTVCKQMAASQNTATEIKLYAFLYSSWSIIASNEKRKEKLCVDFLLEPQFFESRFNHWCPMVRAYFMRLLCWRVARFDGEESDAQINIMTALSVGLRSVWSHYLWLHEQADSKKLLPPSTTACNPAPGRRFLIIRNDNPVVSNAQPFLSFDGVVQSTASRRLSASNSPPRPLSAASTESLDFPDENVSKAPRWNILRVLMGKPKAPEPPRKEKENTKATSENASKETETSNSKTASKENTYPSAPSHKSYSFRFSLEWVDKRFGTYQPMRLAPPRLPLPAQELLQTKSINMDEVSSSQPDGPAVQWSRYAGRALAEWTFVSHECQNFFDRRKNEGVPTNKQVESPTLAVEAFRRPG